MSLSGNSIPEAEVQVDHTPHGTVPVSGFLKKIMSPDFLRKDRFASVVNLWCETFSYAELSLFSMGLSFLSHTAFFEHPGNQV